MGLGELLGDEEANGLPFPYFMQLNNVGMILLVKKIKTIRKILNNDWKLPMSSESRSHFEKFHSLSLYSSV